LESALEFVLELRASPLVTRGGSLFDALHSAQTASAEFEIEDQLLAVALAAARAWCGGSVPDTGLADSAAVIGGFHPAYTGGPFTYLCQHGLEDVEARAKEAQSRYGERFAVPPGFHELFAKHATGV
jgi:hypothetical protein